MTHLGRRDLGSARATVGLRGGNERVEGGVKLGYLDSGDFRDHFVGVLGAQYRFTRTWGWWPSTKRPTKCAATRWGFAPF